MLKRCNKILIGKTFWKSEALPAILYGTPVIGINETEIKRLQRIENAVGRRILGAPKYATVATIKGEIGLSDMKTRISAGRLRYVKGIEEGKNELLKKILEEIREDGNNKWMIGTRKCMEDLGLNERSFRRLGIRKY